MKAAKSFIFLFAIVSIILSAGCVSAPKYYPLPTFDQTLRLAEELGGRAVKLPGNSLAETSSNYA